MLFSRNVLIASVILAAVAISIVLGIVLGSGKKGGETPITNANSVPSTVQTRPHTRPYTRLPTRPATRPETRPTTPRPVTRPITRPVTRPTTPRPVTRPATRPETRTNTPRPETHPPTYAAGSLVLYASASVTGNLSGPSRANLDTACASSIPSGLTCVSTSAFVSSITSAAVALNVEKGFINSAAGVYGISGVKLADNWSDFTSLNNLQATLVRGGLPAASAFYAGVSVGCGYTSDNCAEFTTASSGTQTTAFSSNSTTWLTIAPINCSTSVPLVCVCDTASSRNATPSLPSGPKVIFYSNALVTNGGNLLNGAFATRANLDLFCQNSPPVGITCDSIATFISCNASAVSDLPTTMGFNPSTAVYGYGGVQVATSWTSLSTNSTLMATLTNSLTVMSGDYGDIIWTGTNPDFTTGDDCAEWSSNFSYDDGNAAADNQLSLGGGDQKCNNTGTLLCVCYKST